jgi:hypothetical protein
MGTLGGSPNPPAMGSVEQSSPAPDAIVMGTLGGSPNPPAMGSVEQSSPAPDAIVMGTLGGPPASTRLVAVVLGCSV